MKKQIREFLKTVEDIPWFAHIGEPLSEKNVEPVDSLEEMVDRMAIDADWENLSYDIDGSQFAEMRKSLGRDKAEDMMQVSGREITPFLEALLEKLSKTTLFQRPEITQLTEKQQRRFLVRITRHIDGAALELEFKAHIKTLFYGDVVDWYRKGRIPCGWNGRYPKGRLMVY